MCLTLDFLVELFMHFEPFFDFHKIRPLLGLKGPLTRPLDAFSNSQDVSTFKNGFLRANDGEW